MILPCCRAPLFSLKKIKKNNIGNIILAIAFLCFLANSKTANKVLAKSNREKWEARCTLACWKSHGFFLDKDNLRWAVATAVEGASRWSCKCTLTARFQQTLVDTYGSRKQKYLNKYIWWHCVSGKRARKALRRIHFLSYREAYELKQKEKEEARKEQLKETSRQELVLAHVPQNQNLEEERKKFETWKVNNEFWQNIKDQQNNGRG